MNISNNALGTYDRGVNSKNVKFKYKVILTYLLKELYINNTEVDNAISLSVVMSTGV